MHFMPANIFAMFNVIGATATIRMDQTLYVSNQRLPNSTSIYVKLPVTALDIILKAFISNSRNN